MLLEAGGERAAVFEESDGALDNVAPAVADGGVADGASGAVATGLTAGRADGTDAVVAKPLADAAGVVGLVAPDPARRLRGAPFDLAQAPWSRAPRTRSTHAPGRSTAARSGTPVPSQRRYRLVPYPPRDRPSAWSVGSSADSFVPRLGGAASPNLRAFGPPLSPIQLVTRVKLGAQHHQHHRKPSLAAPAAVAVVNARYGPERSAMARHGAPDRSVQNSPFSARR